jgi:class 3 adenylate cyclase
MYDAMWDDAGIVRDAAGLARAARTLESLRDELASIGVADSERAFNLTWHDALNLDNLIAVSRIIVAAATARENSRGAHYRTDFPDEGHLATSAFVRVRERERERRFTRHRGCAGPVHARRPGRDAAADALSPSGIHCRFQTPARPPPPSESCRPLRGCICQPSMPHDRIAPMTPKLQCTACGSENRAGRQFCAQCGARLPARCSACGFTNEAGEKFCGGCGAALAAKPEAAPNVETSVEPVPTAPPSAAASDGERRPVTVLFADLVDYTRMSRALDPEDVHAMLERFYAAADDIVERFGGSIDKHIGDSVMAVFGAPVAHDDDAVRAVRAAAEIHRTMPAVGGAKGQTLAVHIGIASGEVVASGLGGARHRAYTVIGNSVNLAARLLKLAGAGQTVLDDAVHTAVQRLARCIAVEDAKVKGIDSPLGVWRFVEFIDAPDRAGAQFVGRAAELAQLGAALASCAEGGAGGTIFVRGEAGIGKSRLVGELRARALAAGFACHTGLVLDFGMAKGREAVREIVMSMMNLPHGATDDARRQALTELLARHPELAKEEPFLRDIVGVRQSEGLGALYEAMDNVARQQGRAAAVVRLLEIACAASPVLVVVEDVHWADKVTLDALAALTRAVGMLPAILALTSRVAGDPLTAAWRASVQGSPLLTIDLGPLGAKDALALAGGYLSAPSAFVRKCVERSGGNPLFLDQLMRTAEERDDALPASLSSLVLARMDRLPEADRTALRAAAVVGQRFPLALVRELAQMPHYTCDVLTDHFLVVPAGDEYLFAHALIRDGVYASLTRARRSELHRAAAKWYGDRDPALVAEHLDRADAPEAPRAYLGAALAQAAALQPERASCAGGTWRKPCERAGRRRRDQHAARPAASRIG